MIALVFMGAAIMSGCIDDTDIAKEDETIERMIKLEAILTDPDFSENNAEMMTKAVSEMETITDEKYELKSEANVTPTIDPTPIATVAPTKAPTSEPTMKLNSPTGYISISEAKEYNGDRDGLKMLDVRVLVHAPIYDTNVLHICTIEGHTSYWLENVRVEIDDEIVGSYTPKIERERNSYACRKTTTIHLDNGIENTGSIVIIGTFGKMDGTYIEEYEIPCQVLTPLDKFDYE